MGVLPSYLAYSPPDPSLRSQISSEFALRIGTVVKKYGPKSEESWSKKFWEYDVQVIVQDGSSGQPTPQEYPHCQVASMFGSISDYCFWAPRIEEKQEATNPDGSPKDSGVKFDPDAPDMGSSVVVLCANGQAGKGYIVGAIHHPTAADAPEDLDKGPYYETQYNGVNVKVTNDGELVIERNGPTKVDGEPVSDDDDNVGAKLTLDKEGVVLVQTGDGKQSLKLDLQNGKLEILADKGVTIEVSNGKLETNASNGVKLGGDEKLILGNKYVDAEDAFLTDLQGKLSQLVGYVTGLASIVAAIVPMTGTGAPAGALAGPLGALSAQLPLPFTQFKTKLKSQVLSDKNTTE